MSPAGSSAEPGSDPVVAHAPARRAASLDSGPARPARDQRSTLVTLARITQPAASCHPDGARRRRGGRRCRPAEQRPGASSSSPSWQGGSRAPAREPHAARRAPARGPRASAPATGVAAPGERRRQLRLHGDRGEPSSEDVVHVAREAQPLLRHGEPGLRPPRLVELDDEREQPERDPHGEDQEGAHQQHPDPEQRLSHDQARDDEHAGEQAHGPARVAQATEGPGQAHRHLERDEGAEVVAEAERAGQQHTGEREQRADRAPGHRSERGMELGDVAQHDRGDDGEQQHRAHHHGVRGHLARRLGPRADQEEEHRGPQQHVERLPGVEVDPVDLRQLRPAAPPHAAHPRGRPRLTSAAPTAGTGRPASARARSRRPAPAAGDRRRPRCRRGRGCARARGRRSRTSPPAPGWSSRRRG